MDERSFGTVFVRTFRLRKLRLPILPLVIRRSSQRVPTGNDVEM